VTWRPTNINDDPSNWDGEKVYGKHSAHLFSVKRPLPWFRSFSCRSFSSRHLNQDAPRFQVCSHLERSLEKHVGPLTRDAGIIPVDLDRVLDFGVEVFILSEGCAEDPSRIDAVWRHSLRTGYLAALITLNQGAGHRMVWQSFVGGILHDIGMVVFLTQHAQVFSAVVEVAQSRGWDLPMVERRMLGTTHADSGAAFLSRWAVDEVLLATVAYHDDPLQVPHSTFGPLTAVYAANLVEGGGLAQDGDGIIDREEEAYLTRLGLWDDLPLWQGWMRSLHRLTIQ
jgi:hypothetical protein